MLRAPTTSTSHTWSHPSRALVESDGACLWQVVLRWPLALSYLCSPTANRPPADILLPEKKSHTWKQRSRYLLYFKGKAGVASLETTLEWPVARIQVGASHMNCERKETFSSPKEAQGGGNGQCWAQSEDHLGKGAWFHDGRDSAVEKLISGLPWHLTAILLEAYYDALSLKAPCRVRPDFPPLWGAGSRASQQPSHHAPHLDAKGSRHSAEPRQQDHAWQDPVPAGSSTWEQPQLSGASSGEAGSLPGPFPATAWNPQRRGHWAGFAPKGNSQSASRTTAHQRPRHPCWHL